MKRSGLNRASLVILIVAAIVGAGGLLDRGPAPASGPVSPVAALAELTGTPVPTAAPLTPAPEPDAVDVLVSTGVISRDVAEQIDRASASAPVLTGVSTASDPVVDVATVPRAAPMPHADFYRNCAEMHAAGVAPLQRGDNGYRPALDRDDDGIACEIEPTSTGAPTVTRPPVDPRGPDGEDPREDDLRRHDDQTDDERAERDAEASGLPAPTADPCTVDPGRCGASNGDPKDLD